MFKNMFKRSWLSTTRKLGRTIILSAIFFIMAALVLSAIIVKSAVSAQMDYAKSILGGTVTIQANMEEIRNDQREQIDFGADRKELFKEMERPSVDVETADAIAAYSTYVKDYSYEISTGADASDLDLVEFSDNMGGNFGGPGGMNMGGGSFNNQSNYDVSITGVNAFAYVDGVSNGSLELKSGTYFDESTDDAVIISYELAELNELSVGDVITLVNVNSDEEIAVTIIGIYDSATVAANANSVYMNTATAAKFLSEADFNAGNYNVTNVNFYMQNSEYADEFVEKINSDFPELAENNLKVVVDTSEYDAISGSIESVGSFATSILIIVIIAAVIIVSLIVTIDVKDRRYEMGVLLSLGATKKNIIGQIATELFIVGAIGFILASATGNFGAKIMGENIVNSQTATSAEQAEKNFGRPQAPAPAANADTQLDINASATDFILLFVIGYSVIIVSLIIPSVNILRYEPKEILTGKE